MLIERDQVIVGLPAVPLRELMRELMQCSMSRAELHGRLDAANLDPTGAVDRLAGAGFIQVAERGTTASFAIREGEDPDGTTLYTTTIAGNALAKARIGKPMKRSKADQLLAALLQRVEDENRDPESLFSIESVSVFGSYADESNDAVGDIDVHLVYRHRYDADEHRRRNDELLNAARSAGRAGPTSIFAHLTWAEDQFFKRLRARQSRLDIQFDRVGDGKVLPPGARVRSVFPRPSG